MKETQKRLRDYLAAIGKARWAGQPARAHQIACAANGRDPGNETGRDQSRQTVATAQSQIAQALLIQAKVHAS